jgi:hypothetical protein
VFHPNPRDKLLARSVQYPISNLVHSANEQIGICLLERRAAAHAFHNLSLERRRSSTSEFADGSTEALLPKQIGRAIANSAS